MSRTIKISLLIFLVMLIFLSTTYCYIIINFTIYGKVYVEQFLFDILNNIEGIGSYIAIK